MVTRALRFNTYLLLLAAVGIFAGCQSAESQRKKALTILGVHLEGKPDPTSNRTGPVTLLRNNPITMIVEKSPFLNEGMVKDAAIVGSSEDFVLTIRFDQRGAWLLEQYTSRNSGKHLAVSARFGGKMETYRWIAAPLITRRIADGVLTFTPDTDRAETEQIVIGLKNVAKESQPAGESPAK